MSTSTIVDAQEAADLSVTRVICQGGSGSLPSANLILPQDPNERFHIDDEIFGFRLLFELGRGTFAKVFLARQADLAGRLVVLKLSSCEGAEPQTLAQLQHTHIVPIYSVHEDAATDLRAVCMPYFSGASLAEVLTALWRPPLGPTGGQSWSEALATFRVPVVGAKTPEPGAPLPRHEFARQSHEQVAAWIAARLAEALAHAHRRGVIHRDIKPSNILLAADGQPLLLDFNVAKNTGLDPSLNITGGTASYAAPEQMNALLSGDSTLFEQIDGRSDVFSLGLVLFKMLTGANPIELSRLHMAASSPTPVLPIPYGIPAPSVRAVRRVIPWSLESIVRKCLDPDPAQRYQSAADFAEDLNRFRDDRPLRFAPELSRIERARKWGRRHPRLATTAIAMAAILTIVTAAGAGLSVLRTHLGETQEQLTAAADRERVQAFDAGVQRSLCLINTITDLQDHLRQGMAKCEATLGLYEVLEHFDWQDQPAWRRLQESERSRLAEKTRELLVLLALARVQMAQNDLAAVWDGLDLLDRAEAIADLPPSRALALSRAQLLDLAGRPQDAREARVQGEQIDPAGPQDHYLLAATLARRGAVDSLQMAVGELDRALILHPNHYWALTLRGVCRQELNQPTLAVADFSTCIGVWPEFAWGHFNRGYVLGKSGHAELALRDFAAALDREPDFVEARVNRGLLLLEQKKLNEALADFDRARQLGRDDAFLHAGRGVALEGLGQFRAADDAFQAAFARAADLPIRGRIHWVYGSAVQTRLPERAWAAFEEVLRTQANHPQALYGLAAMSVEKAKLKEALGYFDRAVAADSGFVEARRGRAVVNARLEHWEAAGRDINWCLEKEPRGGATLYAAASVVALAVEKIPNAGVAEQALLLLEKAFAENYGRAQAARDPDLNGIRGDPRFRKLIER